MSEVGKRYVNPHNVGKWRNQGYVEETGPCDKPGMVLMVNRKLIAEAAEAPLRDAKAKVALCVEEAKAAKDRLEEAQKELNKLKPGKGK